AHDLALRSDDDAIGIDPQAHRPIGKGSWDTVAIALQMHEAGRSDALGVLDKAVKEPGNWHQTPCFLGPEIGDRAVHLSVWGLRPKRFATRLEPFIQSLQRCKAGYRLEEAMPRILHVLLDLSLLPAGRRIAELGLEEIVAGHRLEANVDVTILAAADLVDR